MILRELSIRGVFEITLDPRYDERGFFMRTYDEMILRNWGLNVTWVQENHSHSTKKGTIRGLHFQKAPFDETKMIRCIRGRILDVIVDIRKSSDTLGQWLSIELSEENKKTIIIPKGFAHGFCTLIDDCEILYKVDNVYSPENESGLIWNDPDLKIDWPVDVPIISEKDKKNLTFKQYLLNEYKII